MNNIHMDLGRLNGVSGLDGGKSIPRGNRGRCGPPSPRAEQEREKDERGWAWCASRESTVPKLASNWREVGLPGEAKLGFSALKVGPYEANG
jgi:hypothetical protein